MEGGKAISCANSIIIISFLLLFFINFIYIYSLPLLYHLSFFHLSLSSSTLLSMTRLFRSKSCGLVGLTHDFSTPPARFRKDQQYYQDQDDEDTCSNDAVNYSHPISTPFISPSRNHANPNSNGAHFTVVDILVAALRKSIITCSVEREDVSSMDISSPTEVRHLSHVTFDRFDGFLGLPTEFEPELPRKVPSASANVFGVSAKSMQCSYDDRGNSVPTILLMMQKRLYVEGGLKAEGIFRINAENSHEEYVRNELNKGVVPRGIDVHCLAGLIKAWFRELPSGVLDSLTPEQVMRCNTEDDCTRLVESLPSTESALLDWAINLMADVVEHEQYNKMNARNIAMVFAPNMTQMADPLTALIHAVQVMNLLKTLILKTLRTREESAATARLRSSGDSLEDKSEEHRELVTNTVEFCENSLHNCAAAVPTTGNFLYLNSCTPEPPNSTEFATSATMTRVESNTEEKHWSFPRKSYGDTESESVTESSPLSSGTSENEHKGSSENGDWLSLRKGVRRLYRGMGFMSSRGGGEAWA